MRNSGSHAQHRGCRVQQPRLSKIERSSPLNKALRSCHRCGPFWTKESMSKSPHRVCSSYEVSQCNEGTPMSLDLFARTLSCPTSRPGLSMKRNWMPCTAPSIAHSF
jgi:hypothetical protein